MNTLIIGYGNRSRTDDGAGWVAVEKLQALNPAGVEFLTTQQLDIDLAETVSHCDTVIFVDAATPQSSHPVTRAEVEPKLQSHAVAHYLTPSDVLAMCHSLYGRRPRGIFFSIRGYDFNFGTTLTPQTEMAVLEVVREIAQSLAAAESVCTR